MNFCVLQAASYVEWPLSAYPMRREPVTFSARNGERTHLASRHGFIVLPTLNISLA